MLAISTAYWPSLEDGQKILDEADRLGFSAVEISTYTGQKALDEMLPALRRMRFKTVSLHNPCPKFEPRLLPWETERPEPLVTAEDPEGGSRSKAGSEGEPPLTLSSAVAIRAGISVSAGGSAIFNLYSARCVKPLWDAACSEGSAFFGCGAADSKPSPNRLAVQGEAG